MKKSLLMVIAIGFGVAAALGVEAKAEGQDRQSIGTSERKPIEIAAYSRPISKSGSIKRQSKQAVWASFDMSAIETHQKNENKKLKDKDKAGGKNKTRDDLAKKPRSSSKPAKAKRLENVKARTKKSTSKKATKTIARKTTKTKKISKTISKVRASAIVQNGGQHLVTSGESLGIIAQHYGVSMAILAQANDISPPYMIRMGQKLVVPQKDGDVIASQKKTVIDLSALSASRPQLRARRFAIDLTEKPKETYTSLQKAAPKKVDNGRTRFVSKQANSDDKKKISPIFISLDKPAPGLHKSSAKKTMTVMQPISKPKPALKPKHVARTDLNLAPKSLLPERIDFNGKFSWPVDGRLLSVFGQQDNGFHNDGISIATTRGESVRAAADGVVIHSGTSLEDFGGLVIIKHGSGWVSTYGHNSELLVKRGDLVRAGEVIARAGHEPQSRVSQLHFGIRQDNDVMNPLAYLPQRSMDRAFLNKRSNRQIGLKAGKSKSRIKPLPSDEMDAG